MKFQMFINHSILIWPVLAMILLVELYFNVFLQTAWTAGPIYVDADAPGPTSNGLSWTTAYTNVQDALAAATNGSEIWVAAGVYTPTHKTNPGDPHTATFQLQNGVSLYGGFAGAEISRRQRNWTTNVTVLSGDLDGNDITTPNGVVTDTNNITGANAYHVITSNSVTQTAVLDGFTITAGRADGSWETNDDLGSGMYNEGSPALTNVTFSGNSATVGSGGGMRSSGNPTLTNVTFSGNSASETFGGGMSSGGNPTLTNVTFNGNSAAIGGGMSSGGNPTLINIIFNGNSALYGGGGMHSSGNPTLTNVIFSGNSNAEGGGGMDNYGGGPTLTNVTFSGNSVDSWGGGGMYNSDGSSPTLVNCILWGNSDNQIENVDGSTSTISYSLVEGSGGSSSWDTNLGTDGGSNIDADPLFVDADGLDNIVGTPDDNLHLQVTSPAIDAGNNDALPADTSDLDNDGNTTEKIPLDVNGTPRLVDNIGNGYIVDMGACEEQSGMPSVGTGFIYLPIVSKNN